MATNVRLTQLAVEVVNAGSGDLRLTQLAVEVVNRGTGDIRLTQLCVEVVTASGNSALRLTQLCVETVQQNDTIPSTLLVTQTGLEVPTTASGAPRVTQTGLEAGQARGQAVVTQTGLEGSQARGQTFVTQVGAEASQQRGVVAVSQIGLEIAYVVPPRGEPGGLPCPEFFTVGADVYQACPTDQVTTAQGVPLPCLLDFDPSAL